MNWLLRLLLILAVPLYAVDDGGGDAGSTDGDDKAGTGDAAGETDGAAGVGADGSGTDGAADKGGDSAGGAAKKPDDTASMLAAIEAGLAKNREAKGDEADGQKAPSTQKPAGKTDAEVAAEADKAAKDKAAADAKALEGKTADDFKLTPEQEAVLKKDSRDRFQKLHSYAKAKEAEIAKMTPHMQELEEARNNIMGILEESRTEPEELGRLLDFNKAVKTGRIQEAIGMIEEYRAELYKAIGQEAPGVDLLKDFPELRQRVENSELSREDAVKLANAERREQALQRQSEQQRNQHSTVQQRQQQADNAVKAIEAWTAKMAKEDAHFGVRQHDVAQQIEAIFAEYPPHLWLKTIQKLYDLTPLPAAKPKLPSGDGTLRPTGTKPGPAKPATDFEAISQGLGYNF